MRELGTRDRLLSDRDESEVRRPMEKMSEYAMADDDDSHDSGMLPNMEDYESEKEKINFAKDALIDINKF